MRVSYGPAADNLTGFLLRGDYETGDGARYPAPSFEVLDLEGFTTLAFLHAQWRSSGIVDRNLTEPVTVPFRDLLLIECTVENGLNFYDVMERNARASNEPNLPAILAEIGAKRQVLSRIGGISGRIYFLDGLSGATAARLSRGEIESWLGAPLERLVPGSSQRLVIQYRDRKVGNRPLILCDPQADEGGVGPLLCGFVFTSADRRTPGFCPDGFLVNELAAVRSCKIANGVESDCLSSITEAQ